VADWPDGNLGTMAEGGRSRGGFVEVGGARCRFLSRRSNLEVLCSGCHGGS